MTGTWTAEQAVVDHGNGLWQIDLGFQNRRGIISAWLLHGDDSWALIETGPSSTLDHLRSSLQAIGITAADLDHILLTHIHLDHGGAAGVLAEQHAGTVVHVHPFGAPHLIDPGKLIASATRIYTDQMDSLWGTIRPVPESQVAIYGDGEVIEICGRPLQIVFTPGHAWHHVAVFDRDSRDLFTGDVAGIRMTGMDYICPPTPPPDLDPDAWRSSISTLQKLEPARLCLAHFGMFSDAQRHLQAIGPALDRFLAQGEASFNNGDPQEVLTATLHALMRQDLETNDEQILADYELATPSYMAAMGLNRYFRKRAEAASTN
ncbi:MAG: MBL fold metallo-hydrolase [Thermomicrobiales bacterium]